MEIFYNLIAKQFHFITSKLLVCSLEWQRNAFKENLMIISKASTSFECCQHFQITEMFEIVKLLLRHLNVHPKKT